MFLHKVWVIVCTVNIYSYVRTELVFLNILQTGWNKNKCITKYVVITGYVCLRNKAAVNHRIEGNRIFC